MFKSMSPQPNETPWFPLFMVMLCGMLFVLAIYTDRSMAAGPLALLGALNGWRAVTAWKKIRLEQGLKENPELWRLYQERRRHND